MARRRRKGCSAADGRRVVASQMGGDIAGRGGRSEGEALLAVRPHGWVGKAAQMGVSPRGVRGGGQGCNARILCLFNGSHLK